LDEAAPEDVETVFYDGHCGLCHRFVRFVIARDRDARFHFAPLSGALLRESTTEAERAALPDSVAVRTAQGALLVRSSAVLHVLERLGGGWRGLARAGRLVPRPLRDLAYDLVARVRGRLFARPPDVCPLLPKELAGRFDLRP
jgi:predicted DCC family thiol-disulfide oxidoreductase YuxK